MTEVENELQGRVILVTGAAGFVGARLVAKLLESKARVLALVDEGLPLERIEPLLSDRNLRLVKYSIPNTQGAAPKWQDGSQIDYIVHLGVHVPDDNEFLQQATEDIKMNLLSTMSLIQTVGDTVKGICFASSVSVYGTPTRLPVSENDPANPGSSYAVTKLAIENYLKAYGKSRNIPVTILRYATIYGPGELKHRAIPNFMQSISIGKPPEIHGDGSEVRDYVYIDDAVRATIMAISRKPEGVFNIGSGVGHTTLEIARKVVNLYSGKINPHFLPGTSQPRNIVCDITAAKQALAYYPQMSLEDGLAEEIKWFKNQVQSGKHLNGERKNGDHQLLFNYPFLKSVIDRTVALMLITFLSPIMVLISIGIRLNSNGNPIFMQERVGKNGRRFIVYKFRTMYAKNDDRKYKEYLKKYVMENAPYRIDKNGQAIYKVDDCHITRFGSWLRKTNLDELPQFVNVLKGEMSLVGPRPDVPFAVNMYNSWHMQRLQVKPGMTGPWQVQTRKELSFEDMVRMDINYIKKQSLTLDLKMMLLTIGTILKLNGS
jgi:lipopolysaccharide/colanic/teichoic acid biosynthesis glycosyltransferase/nucleoside-diphosphate-sugar epimerase